jgi:hypothetical protein
MARIRTVKPEFQNSQSMGRVSRDARLTFIEIWPQCDDAGRIRANSRMLASVLFPYDEDAPQLIDQWLSELEKEDCIVRYRIGNDEYLQVSHWEHQKIDHPQPSKLPPPPAKKQRKTRLTVREDSRMTGEASENVRAVSSTVSGPVPDRISESRALRAEFDEKFWPIYPRKVGKPEAFKAFVKARKTADLETILSGVRRYALARASEDAQYTKHPGPWLNAGRWEDETPRATHTNGATGPSTITLEERIAAARALDEKKPDVLHS